MARQEDFQSKWIPLFWFNNGALLAKVYPKKAMFDTLEADIVILQETKIQRKDLTDDMVLVPGWDCYFSLPRHEKGKFGVVIYTRQSICAPIRAEEGLTGTLCPPNTSIPFCEQPESQQIGGYPTQEQAAIAPNATELSEDFVALDCEGRCVILEFPAFVLFGLYCPASRDQSRNAFRYAFHNLLDIRIRNLIASGKQVIVAGDLNIIRSEHDMANAEADLRKANTTVEEYFSMPARKMLNQWLKDGVVYGELDSGRETPILHDLCRAFHPERKGMFTCWETKINARPGNYGSRIDYILCSLDMKDWFSDSNIQEGLLGSDHCPVYAVLKDIVNVDSKEVHMIDMLNPVETFKDGKRIRDYSVKDILPTSGKLIPEFNNRRSIKDMLTKRPNLPTRQSKETQDTENTVMYLSSTQESITTSTSNSSEFQIQRSSKPLPSSGQRNHNKRSAPSESKSISSKRSKSATSDLTPNQRTIHPFFIQPASPTNPSTPPRPTKLQRSTTNSPSNSFSITSPSPTKQSTSSPAPKSTWSALFAKPIRPNCEGHDEPCKTMATRKRGVNCGRNFWMCAKPLGPSGENDKIKGSQWRCGTFIWGSDWSGSGNTRSGNLTTNTNGNGSTG